MENTTAPQKREAYHHGDLRAQLIEATRQLVEAHGPEHLSVSAASRAAGVSTAAPYKHFKDKDDLLRAVAYEGMGRQFARMVAELQGLPARSLERIVAMGRGYVTFAQDEPAVFRLMFGLSEDHGADDALVARGEETFGRVQHEVAAYRGSASVEEIDLKRAFQLWSFVHGLSFLSIDGKLEKGGMPFDLDMMLRDIAQRVLTDPATP